MIGTKRSIPLDMQQFLRQFSSYDKDFSTNQDELLSKLQDNISDIGYKQLEEFSSPIEIKSKKNQKN